jgi:hypothetical protein
MAAAWFSIVFLPAPAALTGNHHRLSHHHISLPIIISQIPFAAIFSCIFLRDATFAALFRIRFGNLFNLLQPFSVVYYYYICDRDLLNGFPFLQSLKALNLKGGPH